jgi:hypothetical protein
METRANLGCQLAPTAQTAFPALIPVEVRIGNFSSTQNRGTRSHKQRTIPRRIYPIWLQMRRIVIGITKQQLVTGDAVARPCASGIQGI